MAPADCVVCSKTFSDARQLMNHESVHKGVRAYKCEPCQLDFFHARSLAYHVQNGHCRTTRERTCQCWICGKLYSSRVIARHVKVAHDSQDPPRYGCAVCAQPFYKSNDLRRHLVTKHGIGRFPCALCPKEFNCKKSLTIHIRDHTGEKPFMCDFCGKAFKAIENLKVHVMIHTGERPFACDLCGKGFRMKKHLNFHKTTACMPPVDCIVCGERFDRPRALISHELLHAGGKSYQCHECGLAFFNAASLEWHAKEHAGEPPSALSVYQCHHCGKTLSSQDSLNAHVRRHEGKLVHACTRCDERFASRQSLRAHEKRSHATEPINIVCDVCGRDFASKAGLANHMVIHGEVRPLKCELCDKTFVNKAGLTAHSKLHSGNRYPCPVCGRDFSALSNMRRHIKMHSGEKPHACEICGNLFAHKHQVRVHMRRHTGERPFKCEYCGLSFSELRNMHVHVRTRHTGEKPYVCAKCQQAFFSSALLAQHNQRCHNFQKFEMSSDSMITVMTSQDERTEMETKGPSFM